jgi:hypothetical protein
MFRLQYLPAWLHPYTLTKPAHSERINPLVHGVSLPAYNTYFSARPPSGINTPAFPIPIALSRTHHQRHRRHSKTKTETSTNHPKRKKTEQEQATMCIRTITHWLPCCHQRCTSIELCPDAITTLSTTTTPTATRTDGTGTAKATSTEAENHVSLFDCSAGGPVFSDQASEGMCPVCKGEEEGEVVREEEIGVGVEAGAEVEVEVEAGLGAEIGDMDDESFDGHQEAEEAETLAALG